MRPLVLAIPVSVLLTCTACFATAGLHPAMHPSVDGGADAAGIAAGAVYLAGTGPESEGYVQVPYGEGVARFGVLDSQVELRVTPSMSFVSWRRDLLPAQEGPVGLAVLPSMGAGFWTYGGWLGSGEVSTRLVLAPSTSLLLSVAGGQGYLAPRVGFLHTSDSDTEPMGQLSLGACAGVVREGDPWDLSLELSFQWLTATSELDSGDFIVLSPTLGITL